MILFSGRATNALRNLPHATTRGSYNTTRWLTDTTRYSEALEQYFNESSFRFAPEKQEKGVKYLKECMECVYLRQRPLVAFDVEAYERATSKVTEIGISIYDPALADNSIFPQIHNVHLISKEHIRMRNSKFCPDNKDHFMGGTSIVATATEVKKAMRHLLEEYIQKRQGAFVGHQIGSDIKWIERLGIKIDPDVSTVDTIKIYGLSRKRGLSLRDMLRELQIPHAYLHNAANDAYYTLVAALSLCDPAVRRVRQLDTFLEAPKVPEAEKRRAKFSDKAATVAYANAANTTNLTVFPTIDNYKQLWVQMNPKEPDSPPESEPASDAADPQQTTDPEMLKLLGEAEHIQLTLEETAKS